MGGFHFFLLLSYHSLQRVEQRSLPTSARLWFCKERVFYWDGDWSQVTQRHCGVSLLGDIQILSRHCPGHPALRHPAWAVLLDQVTSTGLFPSQPLCDSVQIRSHSALWCIRPNKRSCCAVCSTESVQSSGVTGGYVAALTQHHCCRTPGWGYRGLTGTPCTTMDICEGTFLIWEPAEADGRRHRKARKGH